MKFSLLKEHYSPLLSEKHKDNDKVEKSKFAYDGPQAFELTNPESNDSDDIDIVHLVKEIDKDAYFDDNNHETVIIKKKNIHEAKETISNSNFNYCPLEFEQHLDDTESDCQVEGIKTIETNKSSDTLDSELHLSLELLTMTETIEDNGVNSSNTSGIAIAPCFADAPRDNVDSLEDVDSIQVESLNEQNSYQYFNNLIDVPVEIESFVTAPAPENCIVKCRISRDKRGVDKGIFPIYYLHLERNNAKPIFLLAARRRKMSKTSNYLISCDASDMKRDGFGFLAKLRANFVGTQFSLFDNGQYPGSETDINEKLRRRELAAIIYESNVLGFKGPRKMTILIPGMTSERIPIDFSPKEHEDGLIECWKKRSMSKVLELHNKKPQWNDDSQSYVLNFHGRVTQASVKNFQIVQDSNVSYIVMQFGRTSDNSFSMDYAYPLSAVQAFGIALSSFDGKLACE